MSSEALAIRAKSSDKINHHQVITAQQKAQQPEKPDYSNMLVADPYLLQIDSLHSEEERDSSYQANDSEISS